MSKIKLVSSIVLLGMVLPALAHADLVVGMGSLANPGLTGGPASLSYAGGSAPMIGSAPVTDVGVSSVNGSFSMPCIGCVLNFQTGPDLSIMTFDPHNGLGTFVEGTFAGGGQISVTGSLPGLSTTTTLFSGFFTDPVILSETSEFILRRPLSICADNAERLP
jgi:hypothetical protein